MVAPRSAHTEFWWPPSPTIARTIPRGYGSFEHVVLPEVDPGADHPYSWAHQFGFVGGHGGRLGLTGRSAVFSVSHALDAAGAGAERSLDGWTCRAPYPVTAGRRYRLRVWTVEPGWWAATVADDAAGAETEIGFIRVPPDWRQLGTPSRMSTQYEGGPITSCADLPHCRVVFFAPTAEGGAVEPERMFSNLGEGSCDRSRVEPVPGGVRHEIGH